MNYRHAYHAGNHADVFKHAALSLVLDRLRQKPQPFAVLDTHAGLGLYDLDAEAPRKTGEWAQGVGRVFDPPLAAAPGYSQLIGSLNPRRELECYPGSPEIVRRSLREHDRLIACELHPEDFAALKARYRGIAGVSVHHRDGYEAVGALLPPPERRGLVLIDPPFEQKDEAQRLALALATGLRKWPTGLFMAWYPVKDSGPRDTLTRAAAQHGFPKTLRAEFLVSAPDGAAFAGGGLLVINTPWRLEEALQSLCRELAPRLGDSKASWSIDWLIAPD